MAITSENNSTAIRGFRKSQYRYAMTYAVVTFVVLLILNIYCSIACQNLFYESKKSSMIEKCLLASDEVSTLEVMNSSTVSAVVGQIESLKVSRLLVTDQAGCTLYDSGGAQLGSYALLPEILTALEGNDVCSWKYQSGTIDCRAATPVFYYGTIVGCVYMTDLDTTQGKLIQSLQRTIFFITFLLEAAVLLFSVAFANTYSRRLNRIMASMRVIREGDYSHKVDLGGNDELTILGNGLGLLFLLHPLQNVQEAVDGMGVKPLPVGQGLDAEIGTVNDAVAVQNQQLHTFLHLAPWGVSMISMPRAFSSSRIRSASAKFFSFFAAVRAATSASISGSAEAASSCALF